MLCNVAQVECEHQTQRCSEASYTQRKLEMLAALQRLGEHLQSDELAFVEAHGTNLLQNFVRASDEFS